MCLLSFSETRRDEKPIVLVFFIGGCTFAEVAALKFLSSFKDEGKSAILTILTISCMTLYVQFCGGGVTVWHTLEVAK